MIVTFTLNGNAVSIDTAPDRRVVDLLREDFGLTGVKEGCGSGECGACTVLVDDEARLSCLMLAAQLEGKFVTTIEGLGEGEALHPVQASFIEYGAVQCGFCSPGMILTAAAFLKKNPLPDRAAIREALSGNLCRCTGYHKIVDAVEDAGRVLARREGKTMKKVILPALLDECWDALEGYPEARLFCGGTDLLVELRAGEIAPPVLIGLERIKELSGVREEGGNIWIGAASTHGQLLDNRPDTDPPSGSCRRPLGGGLALDPWHGNSRRQYLHGFSRRRQPSAAVYP